MIRNVPRPVVPLILVAVCLLLGACSRADPGTADSRKPLYYRNPMDPTVTSPVPARDSMGMDYLPVYSTESATQGVPLSSAQAARIGLRTQTIHPAPWIAEIRASGVVEADSRFIIDYGVRAEAWIESIAVRKGEAVKPGQLLYEAFSPRLEASIEEYLSTLQFGDPARISLSERRMRQLGFEDAVISEVRKTRKRPDKIPWHATESGVVMEVNGVPGQYMTPDRPVLRMAKLDEMLVVAALAPSYLAEVALGSEARIELPGVGNGEIMGRVESRLSAVDERTRAIPVRVRVSNRDRRLVPGMILGVEFRSASLKPELQVPLEAVVSDGVNAHVFVLAGNGLISPRRVVLGAESDGRVIIRDGLADGEVVVTNGVFLLDAEANLRERLPDAEPSERSADPPGGNSSEHPSR